MDKDEILARSRKDNLYLDEMQQTQLKNGFGFGGVAVVILCAVFCVIKAFKGESFPEFIAILFGYLAATDLYSYTKIKKKRFLIQGIAESIPGITGFIVYFLV